MQIREIEICERHRRWTPSKCPACHINELAKDAERSLSGAYATNRKRHELELELAKLREGRAEMLAMLKRVYKEPHHGGESSIALFNELAALIKKAEGE